MRRKKVAIIGANGFLGLAISKELSEQGYEVSVPLLPGHGTTPNQLRYTGWNDWLVAARRAFDDLSSRHEKVFIVGFSMGALLATVIAQERGQRVGGLVVMAIPVELDLKSQLVLSLARRRRPMAHMCRLSLSHHM